MATKDGSKAGGCSRKDANIKLDSVISYVVGVSGPGIIEAIIAGQTDRMAFAALADRRHDATPAELECALYGRVTAHHRFLLRLHLDHLNSLEAAISHIDREIEDNLSPFRAALELLVSMPGVSRRVRGL